jgi:hypothetical protein
MRAALLGLASAAVLAISPTANAQVAQALTPGLPIQITGRSNGLASTFSFLLDHFEARNGQVFAIGALSGGNLGQASQVAIPLQSVGQARAEDRVPGDNRGSGANSGPGGDDHRGGFGGFGMLQQGGSPTQPALFRSSTQSALFQSDFQSNESSVMPLIVPAQVACPVLNLVLAPLRLNLLGLVVDLDQVVLNVVAVPGALVGNLLCAVLALLSGLTSFGAIAAVLANVLNNVLSVLGGLPL